MKQSFYMILILSFILSTQANSQVKEKSKFSRTEISTAEYLSKAKSIQDENPVSAIDFLERALKNESRKKGSNYLTEIYFILGNIYSQTKQLDLAEQRFLMALNFNRKGKYNLVAEIEHRLGLLHTELGNEKQAFYDFESCLSTTNLDSLSIRCHEGIIDLHLSLNNNAAAIKEIEKIEKKYPLSKLEIARIEARKSKAYLQLKEYTSAANALQNSYSNLPRGNSVSQEDLSPSQEANEQLLNSSEISNVQKIEIQRGIDYAELNEDDPVRENYRQAKLYKQDRDPEKFEEALIAAINAIRNNTDPSLAAEVYKESYENNLDKGRISKAFDDLEKYISNKEKAIIALEADLKKEIEILKSQKKIDLSQKDIEIEQKESDLLASQISRQKILISFLSLILLASGIFFYFLNKNIKEKRKANQMLYLKSLRTQMNPHFIFNALNSVNNFIAKNDEKTANLFLSDFSKLMRKVLDYSQKDFIAFSDETELNELYLKLEQFRFRDKFEYQYENIIDGNTETEIPPMLIQPFIENAVWHGLRYKEEKGMLRLLISEESNNIIVTIEDNGIGRNKSKALKTKNQQRYNSTGLDNVTKRIALINELYNKNYQVNVSDLNPSIEDTGTKVKIIIPKT